MQEATKKATTPAPVSGETTTPPAPPTGNDALLRALAAHYRATWDAFEALDAVYARVKRQPEDAKRTINHASRDLAKRATQILAAICSIPAEGIAGALVQLEAAFLCGDRAMATDEDDGDWANFRRATWSVTRVLQGITGLPGASVGTLLPEIDPFELDSTKIIATSVALAEQHAAAAEASR